ncbi:hypothetical protein DSM112329_02520 [Paraconexibacter sp. AEG42_29]|uniref:Aldose 1-epimerase n=1 Tax=Paraconexibacter sp. AEG42_29 TaxID=2997339 RepID=A0AAU7AVI9_9ACTN
MPDPEVTLRAGGDADGGGEAVVVVQGGDLLGLRSWSVDGQELLAAPDALPPEYCVHGRRAGVTLLHPWANRLGADAFTVAGREVRVPDDETVSRDAGGLAIHGLAVPGAWIPEQTGAGGCRVRRVVPATAAFPFAHTVGVVIVLEVGGTVTVATSLQALSDPLPVAVGWHPYLVPPGPRAEWELRLPACTRLPADAAGLPTDARVPAAAERALLGERELDDGFADAGSTTWSAGPVVVELDAAYTAAQVFAPGDAHVVSLEPMTAPTDALRTGRGLRVLAPGERLTATFVLRHNR